MIDKEIAFIRNIIRVQIQRYGIMLHNWEAANRYIKELRKDMEDIMKVMDMNLGVFEKLIDKKAEIKTGNK